MGRLWVGVEDGKGKRICVFGGEGRVIVQSVLSAMGVSQRLGGVGHGSRKHTVRLQWRGHVWEVKNKRKAKARGHEEWPVLMFVPFVVCLQTFS